MDVFGRASGLTVNLSKFTLFNVGSPQQGPQNQVQPLPRVEQFKYPRILSHYDLPQFYAPLLGHISHKLSLRSPLLLNMVKIIILPKLLYMFRMHLLYYLWHCSPNWIPLRLPYLELNSQYKPHPKLWWVGHVTLFPILLSLPTYSCSRVACPLSGGYLQYNCSCVASFFKSLANLPFRQIPQNGWPLSTSKPTHWSGGKPWS